MSMDEMKKAEDPSAYEIEIEGPDDPEHTAGAEAAAQDGAEAAGQEGTDKEEESAAGGEAREDSGEAEEASEGAEAEADAEEGLHEAAGAEENEESDGTADEADSASGDEEGAGSGKTELSGRAYRKELEKRDKQIAELNDRYMRTLAEYENFRKRTEKEKADLYSFAVRDVMTKILPVLDNLERGLTTIPEEKKDDPVAEGMDKICKQFQKALDDIGVKQIEAQNQPFDPNLHNAVMHVDDESLGENVVAEEFLKGYTYKDAVVRHSMVKVAN